MKKVQIFLSYVLVAALASFATMLLMGRSMKLAQLERIIETYFVGETDDVSLSRSKSFVISSHSINSIHFVSFPFLFCILIIS